MVLKCVEQIAALNAVIDALDEELVGNPNWQALADLNDVAAQAPSGPDPIFRRLRLEQALARDPLYRARVRLVEAVQMLQQVPAPVGQEPTGPAVHNPDAVATSNIATHEDADSGDDLLRIRGITPSLRDQLHAHNVTQFSQIAGWTRDDRVRIGTALGLGRAISQQNWIEQAALLIAQRKSQAQVPRVQQPVQKAHRDASQTFIKSTPRDVIRGLAAHNDTVTRHSATTTEGSPHRASVSFFPQVVSEPRRASLIDVVSKQIDSVADNNQSATPPPIPETLSAASQDGAARDTPMAESQSNAVTPPPIPLATQSPSRKKFRIRRIKPLKVQPSEVQSDKADYPANGADRNEADVKFSSPFASRTPPVPGKIALRGVHHEPPPIPDKERRMALKHRIKSRSPESHQPNENAERFGKGQSWRDREPVHVGPDLADEVGPDPKVYAHTEEARVEIIRVRPGPASDGMPPTSTPSERDETTAPGPAQSGKFVRRRPRGHLFKGLKRE